MSETAKPSAVVVIPCYNEASRLGFDRLGDVLQNRTMRILFVDDGSTDRTAALLGEWAATNPDVAVLQLPANGGKGEAVRAGLLHAIEEGATIVAYYDADLASPTDELVRIYELVVERPSINVAMGARVALLGSQIERSRLRHYQGRVFASFASLLLGVPVYDTQCGLKVLRVTPALSAALDRPFMSRWVFDVELLMRLLNGPEPLGVDDIVEVPLREWRDVRGSSLSMKGKLGATTDLARFMVTCRIRRGHRPYA